MNRFEAAVATAESEALRALDFSMFSTRDIANVALQRSEVLSDIGNHAEALRDWARGKDKPLMRIADRYRLELVTRALGFVVMEYQALRPLLRTLRPRRIADIGCGYGFFDLFAHADFGCEIILIDTEVDARRAKRFRRPTASYSDLEIARRFLIANGSHPGKISTVNPLGHDVAQIGNVDLAVSFLSCGFAFPVEGYRDFFQHSVVPGGDILIDIRTRNAHAILPGLAGLGRLQRIGPAADGEAIRMRLTTHTSARHVAA